MACVSEDVGHREKGPAGPRRGSGRGLEGPKDSPDRVHATGHGDDLCRGHPRKQAGKAECGGELDSRTFRVC